MCGGQAAASCQWERAWPTRGYVGEQDGRAPLVDGRGSGESGFCGHDARSQGESHNDDDDARRLLLPCFVTTIFIRFFLAFSFFRLYLSLLFLTSAAFCGQYHIFLHLYVDLQLYTSHSVCFLSCISVASCSLYHFAFVRDVGGCVRCFVYLYQVRVSVTLEFALRLCSLLQSTSSEYYVRLFRACAACISEGFAAFAVQKIPNEIVPFTQENNTRAKRPSSG